MASTCDAVQFRLKLSNYIFNWYFEKEETGAANNGSWTTDLWNYSLLLYYFLYPSRTGSYENFCLACSYFRIRLAVKVVKWPQKAINLRIYGLHSWLTNSGHVTRMNCWKKGVRTSAKSFNFSVGTWTLWTDASSGQRRDPLSTSRRQRSRPPSKTKLSGIRTSTSSIFFPDDTRRFPELISTETEIETVSSSAKCCH